MTDLIDLEPTIETIYDAAIGGVAWSDALARIVGVLGASTGLLHAFDVLGGNERVIASLGFKHANVAEYENHYYARDLWRIAVKDQVPTTQATILTNLIPARVWENSEVWNDYVKSQIGCFYCLGAKAVLPREGLLGIGVHRYRDARDFDDRDSQLFQKLLPHLRRAFIVSRQLADTQARQACALDAMDMLAIGVILVDKDCRVVHVNAAAAAILQRRNGISQNAGGFLTSALHKETRRLQQLVAESVPSGTITMSSAGGALAISRPPPRRPLTVIVVPLPRERIARYVSRPVAMVFVSDPEARSKPAPDILTDVYGLTPAEGRLAAALVSGETIDSAATRFGVSKATLRSQLLQIFRKTGTSRQAELVILIQRHLAVLLRERG